MHLNVIKQWYKEILPVSFRLNEYLFINIAHTAFETGIAILENNYGNKIFMSLYERLVEMINKINKLKQ